ncbi:MAG TPA: DUF6438 domain-containing protein [Longimicrobium sp.]
MKRIAAAAAAALLTLTACPRPAARPAESTAQVRADSIVLERTRCYGTCPAYRLTLTRAGQVRFASVWPADTPPGAGTIAAADFASLVDEAARIGFWELPARIEGSRLCPTYATDLPSVYLTIHAGARTKRVDDYLGCMGTPELRALEVRIDSVAGSRRWIRVPELR